MTDFAANRQQVLSQIQNICQRCGVSTDAVNLLAVSKMQSAVVVRQMFKAGQRIFAENYLQEALNKQADLVDLPIEWHFIGQIQRNKTRDLAAHFSWIHGVDRLIIAERLSQHLAQQKADQGIDPTPLNICIQVNIDHEESKGGCLPEMLPDLVQQISVLPHIALRGLMVIPEVNHDDAFLRTRALFEAVRSQHAVPTQWNTLSMGMSGDFADAIAAGATMIRIGTALFGQRLTSEISTQQS
jgi:pyridoxal phosphate enzyme (YggS family)